MKILSLLYCTVLSVLYMKEMLTDFEEELKMLAIVRDTLCKGIVSRGFRWLQMLSMNINMGP